MKIKAILTILLLFGFVISEACSCIEGFKGYKGHPLTLGLSAKVFNRLALIQIQSIDSTGASAKILRDYYNSIEVQAVFIQNMEPNWQCGISTDEFKKGDKLLAVLATAESKNYLSICYESYLNLSRNEINGLVSATKDAKLKDWTISELESELGVILKD